MELVWKQMLFTLERMTAACSELAHLAEQQRQAIVAEEVEQLAQLVVRQEAVNQNLQHLEAEREALVHQLESALGLPGETLRAETLLEKVPAAWSNAYHHQINELRSAMLEIKKRHEVNRRLLEQSQQFLGWLVNFLITPGQAGNFYDAQGQNAQPSYYHIVNQQL
jgi:flagellar biosynthesis/type III secretory pathway chaperone